MLVGAINLKSLFSGLFIVDSVFAAAAFASAAADNDDDDDDEDEDEVLVVVGKFADKVVIESVETIGCATAVCWCNLCRDSKSQLLFTLGVVANKAYSCPVVAVVPQNNSPFCNRSCCFPENSTPPPPPPLAINVL